MTIEYPSIFEQAYSIVKSRLSESMYKPLTVKRTPDDLAASNFPLIVMTETDNYFVTETTSHSDQMYQNVLGVDIYTQEKTVSGTKYDRQYIAEALRDMVDSVLNGDPSEQIPLKLRNDSAEQSSLLLRRTFCRPIPNVDAGVYRIRMQYEGLYRPDKNVIYRS